MSASAIAENILSRRKILLWVGAGNSCSAGIPADTDNERGLAYRLALIHYDNDIRRIAAEVGSNFRISDLARVIQKVRVRELIIQQGWTDLAPGPAHRAIAALVAEGFRIDIVTINFDPLLEKALFDEGVDTIVIFSAATVRQLAEDAAFVVKVHGCPFRDNNAEHLIMLVEELEAPPPWVTTFLNGRIAERVFVYVGFSGNAPYLWRCITNTVANLEGYVNEAFGVDVVPAEQVFIGDNRLGAFYQLAHITEASYSSASADAVFVEVADRVFRQLMLRQVAKAGEEAAQHQCGGREWLEAILNDMSYENIRSFVRKLAVLTGAARVRSQDIAVWRVFKWMLVLTSKGVIERASLRPVLACPYYPGQRGRPSAPIIFFDGSGKEVALCLEEITKLRADEKFKTSIQVGAEPRWYAVITNCSGCVEGLDLGIIQRDAQSIAHEYDPVLPVDENTMVSKFNQLAELFQP
jgi:hypothetical protein